MKSVRWCLSKQTPANVGAGYHSQGHGMARVIEYDTCNTCSRHSYSRYTEMLGPASLVEDGESPYGAVDGEEVVAMPPASIRGRTSSSGTFVGMFDLRTMVIRIDSEADPAFWLEIELDKVPGICFAPDGPGAKAARAEFDATKEVKELIADLAKPVPPKQGDALSVEDVERVLFH